MQPVVPPRITAPTRTVVDTRSAPSAWSDIAESTRILSDAGRILQSIRHRAESLQRRAYSDGHASGFASAQAESAQHVLEAKRKAHEFADASEQHIAWLVVSILARIAPQMGEASVVAALLAKGLNVIHEERELRVSVSHGAALATRATLARWQQVHPTAVVQVLIDPQLEPFGCVLESEQGRMDLGLRRQLETVWEKLTGIAAQSLPTPTTETDPELSASGNCTV